MDKLCADAVNLKQRRDAGEDGRDALLPFLTDLTASIQHKNILTLYTDDDVNKLSGRLAKTLWVTVEMRMEALTTAAWQGQERGPDAGGVAFTPGAPAAEPPG
eukprot:COSAG04_NODE_1939_length_5175_cov_5.418046_6_plen_103_part_00